MNSKISVIPGRVVQNNVYKQRVLEPAAALNKVLSLVFPPRFLDNLMNEQLIDINTANKWLLEYRKFLVLVYFSNGDVYPSEQVDQVWRLHASYTQHYRLTYQTFLERDFKYFDPNGYYHDTSNKGVFYSNSLSLYKAIFLIDTPGEVWETPENRFAPKNIEFMNINLYRLAVLYSLKVVSPNFLYPGGAPPVPTAPQTNLKSLPVNQKKFIVRRNKRNKFKNQQQSYGWRDNYDGAYYGGNYHHHHDHSHSSSSDDHNDRYERDGHRCRNRDHDYYGPNYMVGGGLIIIGNPCDERYINDSDFGGQLHEGMYDDMDSDNFADMDIDDIADCAQADADLVGEGDLGEYGGDELGIDNPAEDLGLNEEFAEVDADPDVDMGGSGDFGADLGGDDGGDAGGDAGCGGGGGDAGCGGGDAGCGGGDAGCGGGDAGCGGGDAGCGGGCGGCGGCGG